MKTVKAIIDEWDPIGLFPYVPNNEYHSEIEEIEKLLSSSACEAELADGIHDIFLRSFNPDTFKKSLDECTLIAREILSSTTNRF